MVPASPAPLMPSAFHLQGTLRDWKSKNGRSSARGIA